ncbi:ZZ-type zinc finger-containing protein 3 [Nephila pilipes]|uniref:ZZ-type zinc finger-containing protein 3 n=1 Tax=Nephila pilipes TaxID=299642 RepID=A0A8X6U808_NEPPI|nr:ZZ-type zinc finger-containing protein 3 [Nephila pilipes]
MDSNTLNETEDSFINVDAHNFVPLEKDTPLSTERVVTHDYVPGEKETPVITEKVALSNKEMVEILNDHENKPPKIDYDCIGEFCFESDQLALKGNNDYKKLLEAIVILEAQRAQAVKDIERLVKIKEEALADPFEFLARMQRKEKMNFPVPQKIHSVPVIDWSKYALSGNPAAFGRRQMNLQKQMAQEFSRNNARAKLNLLNTENNQSWSAEEQKKLKELLVEFPPEDVEVHRWEKIANILGTRTPFEVASRVHKYYSILSQDHKISLGKIPDLIFLQKHWHNENTENNRFHDWQHNSTENTVDAQLDVSDEEDINCDKHNTANYQELINMKKLLREKILEESSSLVQHFGYKCCHCKADPIIGIRWHCTECQPPLSIDFCDDCSQSAYETDLHKTNHHLEKVYGSKGFLDREYMQCLGSNYNYLDPNYMPAT